MPARTFIEKLRESLRKFSAAKGGNVMLTFALSTIPMIGFVGAAVDYSRANSAKAAMQAAVDATALMLAKNISTLTSSQINQETTNYFNALFNRTEVKGIVITPTYTTSGGAQVVVTGTGSVNTSFMRVMGQQALNISVSSTVKWGNSRLRVALVLDNTGSMASAGKMTALKTATKNLLTQLKNAASQNGDVYVSIIPFSKDVNVDPANYNQSWVRWDLWDAANGGGGGGSSGFINYGNGTFCLNGWYWNGSTLTFGNCPAGGGGGSTLHQTWNGCVTDRDQDYDTLNTAPASGTQATLFPAEQYISCPVPLMALTYDWTALNNKVDAMLPNGNTNQAIGLQWGWQSLTSAPFTIPAKDPNYKYQEVIILLTDGLNTQDRWYTSQASIDARQKKTCDNVKAAGITLYTVQVNTDGDPTSTLLQQCASDSSKFFLLTSASAIVTAFQQIGTSLSNLRVAK